MNKIIAKACDFRILTLAVAGALALAAGQADARPAHKAYTMHKPLHGGSVQRSRGADGAEGSRNPDGTVNRKVTSTAPAK